MGKFQKGKSGNPGGRPKSAQDVRELALKLFDEDYWASIKQQIASRRLHPAVHVRLLAYAYGEPPKVVKVDGNVTVNEKQPVLRSLPDDVVREVLAQQAFAETTSDDGVN